MKKTNQIFAITAKDVLNLLPKSERVYVWSPFFNSHTYLQVDKVALAERLIKLETNLKTYNVQLHVCYEVATTKPEILKNGANKIFLDLMGLESKLKKQDVENN